MKSGLSLIQAWTALILFAVIVPVTAIMFWYAQHLYSDQLNKALEIERYHNAVYVDHIESEIKRYKTLLRNKSDPLSFLVENNPAPKALSQINTLLGLITSREKAINEVMIISEQGNVIAAINPELSIRGKTNLSSKELQMAAMRADFDRHNKPLLLTQALLGKVTSSSIQTPDGKYAITMSVPIGSPAIAALVAIIDIDKLSQEFEPINDRYTADNSADYIVNQHGILITHITNSTHKPGAVLNHLPIVRSVLVDQQWRTEEHYEGVNYTQVYGTITAIPELNWTLITEVVVPIITQPIWISLFNIFIFPLLGMIVFVYFVLRLSKKTLVPIKNASDAIAQVGRGDYEIELKPSGIRELDAMTSGIMHMKQARQETELALKNKEKEQREMLNSMVNAVISINHRGTIISFNPAATKLFGYDSEEIIGQKFYQLMPVYEANKFKADLKSYLGTADAPFLRGSRELKGLQKKNQEFPMRLSIAELPMDENGHQRFILNCQDLTKINQQKEQIVRSQKMDALGKLTSGIAHDYNNMLGVIMGYSELLKRNIDEQPKLSNYVKQIQYAGDRGVKLTKNLLSFSRKETIEADEININTVLYEQQDLLQKTLTVRINLEFDVADNVWPIWLDRSDLENAILNLSINAMHAMADKESNCKLTISTANQYISATDALSLEINPGDYVRLQIEDTGCGMDDDTKNQIFDPFFSTKGEHGTGLGLSQVFGFVKRAEGKIKVDSELDCGSRFILYFPRYIDSKLNQAESEFQSHIELRGKESILIVDDETALGDLTSELLTHQGYLTYTAGSANEALKILEQEKIDLMLSDIIMPETDGYQLAAAVQDKYPAIKIQLISGFTDQSNQHMIDENLALNILYKPVSPENLLCNIRSLLDMKIGT